MPDGPAEGFPRANPRRNLVTLGLDYALFLVGMSFASQATVLPAFAAHLGASNVFIGAIPAVLTLGWFLPSLFTAAHTESLPAKLPFVLRYTVWERVPLVALALVAFFLAERAPALALGVFLALLMLMAGVGGALMPAWMDLVGRAIPTRQRGRFFGVANLLASAGGLLGSFLTAYVLATVSAPASYGFCFLAGAVFLGLSYVSLASTREPPASAPAPAVPLRAYVRGIPGLLRRDANLGSFLIARAFAIGGAMANGFYTVHALRRYEAAEWQVGVFTTLLMAGQMAGNPVLGWLADRAGHRLVLVVGVAGLTSANLLALASRSLDVFSLVFALVGVHLAAINISARTILLELSPAVSEHPTYIGLGNTALAPVTFLAPLAAGALADRLGFEAVFAGAAVLALIAIGLLLGRVRDPRQSGATVDA